MSRWLITNARLVSDGETTETDVRIERGRIDRIDGELTARPRETVVDARGHYLLPGMIDICTHCREPGNLRQGSLATESRAAVAGGITSYIDMPDTRPPTVTRNALADKFSRANGRSPANFSFFFGADPASPDSARTLAADAAAGMVVRVDSSDATTSEKLLELLRNANLPVLAGGEDAKRVEAAHTDWLRRSHGRIPPEAHPDIHSVDAALASRRTAIETAQASDKALHLLGVGSAAELELLDSVSGQARSLTASVCLPSVYFMDADYLSLGNLIKFDPPVREEEDRRALRRALARGRLDILCSGHAPTLLREKGGHYESAAIGMPLAQFALPAAWSLVAGRSLPPERLVEITAHNPARLLQLAGRGFAREGYWADLVLLDADRRCIVDRQTQLSECGWTPFSGRKLSATVRATWINGDLVWREGLLTGLVPGRKLEFERG